MQKDIIQLISQSGVYYTPTYIVRPGVKNIYVDNTSIEKQKLLYLNGNILFNNYYLSHYESQNEDIQLVYDAWREAGFREHDRAIQTLKGIVELNGKVTVGGHGDPLPGIGMHWEIWFMTKGMTNYQALKAATINGAEKLDLQEEIGTIESNKLADLVILNSNPLENIFNTTDILYTIQNGNIYEAERMNQLYPFKKKLKSWGRDANK